MNKIVFSSKWLLVFIYQLHVVFCQIPKGAIVQLFEWKWLDIATECEQYLGPNGYAGVQTSPAAENLEIPLRNHFRTWSERYQVVSYHIHSRSGDEKDFLNMTTRCNAVGVRIYVDVVLNHMTNDSRHFMGTAGSTVNFTASEYLAVPYTYLNFNHPYCNILDDSNATQVRNCMVDNLKDLNQTNSHVRNMLIAYLNKLVKNGVAGFCVHAAKHMWPKDLNYIYKSVNDLNTTFGFYKRTRPYIYQELTPDYSMPTYEYTKIGHVTEYVGMEILSEAFTGVTLLTSLVAWGRSSLQMLQNSDAAVVFVDNHISQRYGGLNYKHGPYYRAAIAFILAHPYGHPRIMSGYYFRDILEGPPSDHNENIQSSLQNGHCSLDWVCEHRWDTTVRMLKFREVVRGTHVSNWWDNGGDQIAFSRGNKGFIAINIDIDKHMVVTLPTGLPQGVYCDIRSGHRDVLFPICTGKYVVVGHNGLAEIFITGKGEDVYLAIHVGVESRI